MSAPSNPTPPPRCVRIDFFLRETRPREEEQWEGDDAVSLLRHRAICVLRVRATPPTIELSQRDRKICLD